MCKSGAVLVYSQTIRERKRTQCSSLLSLSLPLCVESSFVWKKADRMEPGKNIYIIYIKEIFHIIIFVLFCFALFFFFPFFEKDEEEEECTIRHQSWMLPVIHRNVEKKKPVCEAF
ncbi:hypothetical protein Ddye_006568 [Dipteronia dyeriana]|uniref:Uncharacterized protein n=1 Tax=Dipteronia dyeriana TaxID=168575 RepID=A0AAD9XIL6_9ROSI|nr:hypothetical protein Ddye_006568 [Dipteronia dyeriana]